MTSNLIPFGWSIITLGITQDGGYPQVGCGNICCKDKSFSEYQSVVSLALIFIPEADPTGCVFPRIWIFDMTPDFRQQYAMLQARVAQSITQQGHVARFRSPFFREDQSIALCGVFLTHAHIGHYSGLSFLGKEVLHSRNLPVYTGLRFSQYLEHDGPWSQLVSLKNIDLHVLSPEESEVTLQAMNNDAMVSLSIKAHAIPHRGEFSETLGFVIGERVLFIPDADHWEWNIDALLEDPVQVALLDGTFYSAEELPGRDIRQIPHPFISSSIARLGKYASKIHFTHFNHSNPLLWDALFQHEFLKSGFQISSIFQIIPILS